jgi:UDP-N-acetylglucosamine 4-epimerase
VLHQAALGSVPRSIANPQLTNDTNVTGFLNMLVAARDAKRAALRLRRVQLDLWRPSGLPKVEDRRSASRCRRTP